jgi:aldose 1-epimerase
MYAQRLLAASCLGLIALAACMQANAAVRKQSFGKTKEGKAVELYTLSNSKGMEVAISTYGGIVVSIKVPDRAGKFADVVLGHDSAEKYVKNNGPFMGATIGRYGNRIGHARFSLDGVEYKLAANDGANSLHGGPTGFNTRLWTAKTLKSGVALSYLSQDGEEGFPGALSVTVTFTVTENNELRIHYQATTDKTTVVNLTNHSYFNLAGQGEGDVLGTLLTIHADRFTPVDSGMIPTGELKPVEGTPFDFRQPVAIGARIDDADPQVKLGGGYDHNFVLNRSGAGLVLAARAVDPASGRVLETLTTEPGMQFYAGNFLNGSIKGKGGKAYNKRYGFCLETQHYPDSPNKPSFPTTTLKPGERYDTTTVYRFSVEK